MNRFLLLASLLIFSFNVSAQLPDTTETRKRLDFAQTYFELGGQYFAPFTGKGYANSEVSSFENPATINPYLVWGGFHFWGHAEFYVSIPLYQFNLGSSGHQGEHLLMHTAITGARYLPWAIEEYKIRPYLGFSWSAMDFQQSAVMDANAPTLSKNFMLVPDFGLLYKTPFVAFRVGLSYFYDNDWNYPISASSFEKISTPEYSLQASLIYSFESSHTRNEETNKRWNSYSPISHPGKGANKTLDFFIGIGPSASFSLSGSSYSQANFPYLNDQIVSKLYADVSLGIHFNKAGLFTALSYRNPTFETSGYGASQTIEKSSIALEVNKFLTDYSGFVPFLGINVAYDKIEYQETTEDIQRSFSFSGLEPGINFGWDILPGKTEEFLILRTNLRWYPLASFEIDGFNFDFSQLEYNLIQIIFYPDRFMRTKKK